MVKREFILISIITVIIDQISKYLIALYKPEWILGALQVHYVTNTGAGFGILQGQTFFLGIVSLIVGVGLVYYYKDLPKQRFAQVMYALFLGGVIGNGLDRFFRNFVIDFIDFGWWPAFNVADSAISVAVVGLLYYYVFIEK
jgi:signal peptidase II